MVRITTLVVHGLLYLSYTAFLSLLVMADARANDPVAHFNLPRNPFRKL